MKLHYAGQPGSGYGWGVCNTNLRRELAKLCTLVEAPEIKGVYATDMPTPAVSYDADAVFMPLADHDFNPATPARGKRNLAYTFFEFNLGRLALDWRHVTLY